MQRNNFSEEEAINITIHHGYDGSEFKTAVWKSRGCLNPTRTMDALVSKLETIYHNVKVEGRGKKRRYILTDEKDELTEREFNYKGTVPTKDDETIKEYFFNHLVLNGAGDSKSYRKWGEEFKLLQPQPLADKLYIEEIKKLHFGQLHNPKEVVSEFLNDFRNRNKQLVHNSFNRLQTEGRINIFSVYIFKTIDGKHEEVNEYDYDKAKAFKKNLVESMGVDYRHYILSYHSKHRNNHMENIIRVVDEQMAKEFYISYMYERIGVIIEDNKIEREVPREEFEQAYFQKFIKLSKDRQNKVGFNNTDSFWKKFYLMHTLKLLSVILKDNIKVDGLEELLREEMARISQNEFFDYGVESEWDFE
ncbi:hypothetical protein [Bacillus sp. V5-8f]|uniref:hypothetical protein n=1 Tax=Bacillus sp. V5-8f TaxID=2053044 RepID=UPI000C76EB72|nr:hypothetical protein [Bacillus sp. V5-8f]PLT32527.1 hypothetical protein CUU64_18655 [Bacillus sp. V5-8f]